MVLKTSNSHCWSPDSNPQRIYISSVLSQRNWHVETMGSGIMRLCDGDASWLLQNRGGWGCGNSETGVCWRTVEDGWWISSTACVEICWSWDHWQRGVGCLGSQGSHLTARKPSWDGSRIGWDRGQFYQECLPSPPGGWIQLNVSPRLVLDWAGTSKASLEFATQR